MNPSTVKKVLSEYEIKRNKEFQELEDRKRKLYDDIPKLEKIDQDIASISIDSIKLILSSTDKDSIKKLNKDIDILKKKKIELLKENGYENNYLEPNYECDKCKDTGYIKNGDTTEYCSCLKQKVYDLDFNSSNIYNLSNQNFDNFKEDLYSDEKDEERYDSSLSPKQNIKNIKKLAEEFIKKFDDPNQKNLLFCGSTGLGKTFLSSCIANELIKQGKTVVYQTAPVMLDKIIDYKFGKSNENISDLIYSADLLIIDDLGTESPNTHKLTELFNIINTRLLNQNNRITKTIISTNLSLQDLYDIYEERIVSRIIGNYNACYFYGDDIRLIKK